MINGFKQAKDKIEERYSEFKDKEFYPVSEGINNYVLLVDNNYIFRFPRTEGSIKTLNLENNILNDLVPLLPETIKVPQFIFNNKDEDTYVGYRYIVGEYLTKEVFNNLSILEKERVAQLLGKFLTTLHTMDYNKYNITTYNNKDIYSPLWDEVVNKCFTFLNDNEQEKVNTLFNNYMHSARYSNFTPSLIHGDLKCEQVIYNEKGIGIIDFGEAKVYDPAYDFADIYNKYGEEFLNMVYSYYNGPKDDHFLFRTINIHAERLPFKAVLNSLLMHDDELLVKTISKLKEFINKI